jgi:hypothetical protein
MVHKIRKICANIRQRSKIGGYIFYLLQVEKSVGVALFVKTGRLNLFSITMSPYFRAAFIFHQEESCNEKEQNTCETSEFSAYLSLDPPAETQCKRVN